MATASNAGTAIFDAIRKRRVTRSFTAQPVEHALLRQVVEAARWAPSAGNRRIHIFVVVDDAALIRKVRLMSPGMLGVPAALIVICTDWRRAELAGVKREELNTWIDVGTATQNMLLTAHELGLGAGPVTSFSRSGVQVLLHLPDDVTPELMICLGYAAPAMRVMRAGASTLVNVAELTFWNRYDQQG